MWKNVSNWLKIIVSICKYLIILGIGIYIGFSIPHEPQVIKVDVTKDSIIRDSIYILNDSIQTKILYIEKSYEKENSMLDNLDDSSHVSLFTRYIEDYKRTH